LRAVNYIKSPAPSQPVNGMQRITRMPCDGGAQFDPMLIIIIIMIDKTAEGATPRLVLFYAALPLSLSRPLDGGGWMVPTRRTHASNDLYGQ
jgi:hypothetical protein